MELLRVAWEWKGLEVSVESVLVTRWLERLVVVLRLLLGFARCKLVEVVAELLRRISQRNYSSLLFCLFLGVHGVRFSWRRGIQKYA